MSKINSQSKKNAINDIINKSSRPSKKTKERDSLSLVQDDVAEQIHNTPKEVPAPPATATHPPTLPQNSVESTKAKALQLSEQAGDDLYLIQDSPTSLDWQSPTPLSQLLEQLLGRAVGKDDFKPDFYPNLPL